MDDISQSVPLHWSYGLFEGFSGLLYDRRIGSAWPENGWASHWYFRPVDLYFQDTDGQCFMINTISKSKWMKSRVTRSPVMPNGVNIQNNETALSRYRTPVDPSKIVGAKMFNFETDVRKKYRSVYTHKLAECEL